MLCFSSHFMSLLHLICLFVFLCVSSASIHVCAFLHQPFRPSFEAESPVSIVPPVPERKSSIAKGSVAVVNRDKVMTEL